MLVLGLNYHQDHLYVLESSVHILDQYYSSSFVARNIKFGNENSHIVILEYFGKPT